MTQANTQPLWPRHPHLSNGYESLPHRAKISLPSNSIPNLPTFPPSSVLTLCSPSLPPWTSPPPWTSDLLPSSLSFPLQPPEGACEHLSQVPSAHGLPGLHLPGVKAQVLPAHICAPVPSLSPSLTLLQPHRPPHCSPTHQAWCCPWAFARDVPPACNILPLHIHLVPSLTSTGALLKLSPPH